MNFRPLNVVRRLLRHLCRREPAGQQAFASDYASRIAAEREIFADQVEVHDLPGIFHYWSNKYLRPKLELAGFSHPDAFFANYLERACADAGSSPARFASLGCGNADTEVRVAAMLLERGVRDFTIDCIDINEAMLERGRQLAKDAGVSAQIRTVVGDFNDWSPAGRYAAIMANQSLHHVLKLEGLFSAVEAALEPNGRFITSDMIGRNGHMRWPEALQIVREFWQELPAKYRYNVQLKRHEEQFENWDCSGEGFEGIRAQDILRLLVDRFDFELFIPYANVVDPFIDRSFGPHFDVDNARDREFIDRVHARDEAAIKDGTITPTHLIAVLRRRPYAGEQRIVGGRAPSDCIRL
ncbi:MAG: class I SAM-dependent methyltransferase [Dokdonella sp.]